VELRKKSITRTGQDNNDILITVSNNVTKHSSTSTLQGAHETHTNDDKQIEIVKVTHKTTYTVNDSNLPVVSSQHSPEHVD